MRRQTPRAVVALLALATPLVITTQALAAPSGGGSLSKISFSSSTYSRSEAGGAAVITLKRTSPSKATTSTVAFSTSDNTATAGADYTATNVTVTFAAKQTTQTVNVPILQDNLFEGPETVNLILGSPITNAQLGQQKTATLTIIDDEVGSFSVDDAAPVTEGDTAVFTVTLSAAAAVPTAVTWTATSGTATSGSDFPAQSASLAFGIGQTSRSVEVTTTDDALDEDTEAFTVELSSASAGTSIGDGSGAGTINDNDAQPSVVFSDNPTATEGSDLVYTISLSAASGKTVSGTVGTWSGNTADARYTPVASTAWSILPGNTSTTFTVPTSDDAVDQSGDLTVWARLLSATNATIPSFVCSPAFPDYSCNPVGNDDAWSLGTLQDDDETLSVSDESGYDIDGSSPLSLTFTVSLSGPSADTVTVDYATANWSALAGTVSFDASQDYVAKSGTLTFLPGETSKTVTVDLLDGGFGCEADEEFTLGLSNATGATILDSSGTGTIYDWDTYFGSCI